MNIETLKVFCDIIRFHSFSRAAEENGISQSAVSQSLVQIERSLGATLIDRKIRPFQLTAEGQVFYSGVKDLVVRYYAIENEVRNLRGEVRGEVRVAAIYSVGIPDISSYVQQFSRKYPGSSVRLAFLHPDRVYESVLNDEADIGLISYPTKRREIDSLPWKEETLVAVSAPGQLAAEGGAVRVKDLNGQRFVGFDRDLLIQKEIEKYLSQQDISVETTMSFDNIETIKRAVETGGGFSILPEPLVRTEVREGTLESFALPKPGLKRPIGIVFCKNRPLLRAAELFVELLQEQAGTTRSTTEQLRKKTVSRAA
jgi:DNA-binding transcriptional LysR family regulator